MTSKICKTCKMEKSLDSFGKHKGRRLGLADSCRDCRNQTALFQRFGITKEERKRMSDDHGNKCAICDIHQLELSLTLAVDHCHTTGKIRGLLCVNCNQGLGKFKDNPSLLEAAIKYLQKSK
jgi:hypothetical protein